jgi:PAS domain S-box-containing protein
MEDFRLVMQGEVPPTGEYRMLAKSGQYRTVETMPRPLFAGDKVVGTFGIARDITERRQAEEALRESEGRYRDLVERSPDALVVHSEEKILFVNSAAVKLFGAAAPHQIIGRPIWDFIHPESAKAAKKRIQSARRRREEVAVVEEKFVRLDGEVIDVEMAAIPVAYHGKAARQVVLRDITERKRMEDALQHARDELESRVERRMQRGAPYGLTFRELSVLHLLADGKSDKEIGSVLGISTLTAQKHVENIRTKMGASSRTKASVRAVREGLLQQKTPRDSLHTQ